MNDSVEPVDLSYLNDRARAYVVGLEAQLRSRGEQIEELKAKLADPSRRDAKAIRDAYRRGWQDASNKVKNEAAQAIAALKSVDKVAFETSLATGDSTCTQWD